MTDIVERLTAERDSAWERIKELRADNERLRAALCELRGHVNKQEPLAIIDRALEPKP